MKRPGIVWFLSIVALIAFIWMIFSVFTTIVIFSTLSQLEIILFILEAILLIPYFLFMLYFFMLKKEARILAHISFGMTAALLVIPTLILAISGIGVVIIPFGILVLFWWAYVDYIKNKKIDGQPVFT